MSNKTTESIVEVLIDGNIKSDIECKHQEWIRERSITLMKENLTMAPPDAIKIAKVEWLDMIFGGFEKTLRESLNHLFNLQDVVVSGIINRNHLEIDRLITALSEVETFKEKINDMVMR